MSKGCASIGPRRGRCIVRLAALCCAVVVLALAEPAPAQGTFGMLPDPISTRELMEYADRLGLSAQQRSATHAMHDQYKEEFRALREGEIASFMTEMRSLNSANGALPKREAVEQFVKKMESLNGKITSLDNRLIDQLQTLLTPEQSAMLPRVRLARQRARYSGSQMMWSMGARAVDLSELMLDLDIEAQDRQAVDPILASYEAKLTTAMHALYEASNGMITGMFDAMEQQGFADQDMSDPEVQAKAQEAMMNVWRDITRKSTEASNDIGELNHRGYRSIAAMLPAAAARELRDVYYTRAFPEVGFALKSHDYPFREALKIGELTDEQREAITAARDELTRKIDVLLEQAVALVRESRKDFSLDFNSEKMQEFQRQLAELQTKAAEMQASSMQALTALVPAELAGKLQNAIQVASVAAAKEAQAQMAATGGGLAPPPDDADADEGDEEEDGDDAEDPGREWMIDQFLPGEISKRELTEYATRLELNDNQRTIVDQLHRNYHERFEEVVEPMLTSIQKAASSMWNFDAQTQSPTGPTEQMIGELDRQRREAMTAIQQTDDSFFDELELAVTEEQLPTVARLRLARTREAYNRDQGLGVYGRATGGESAVDLSSLAYRMKLAPSELAAIDGELAVHETAVTPLLQQRYDASLQMNRAMLRWQAEFSKARDDGDEGTGMASVASRYQEIMGEASRGLGEINSQLGKLNRDGLAKLVTLLPAPAADKLRTEFNRTAYPNVYGDRMSVDRQLNEALRLPDLNDQQRQTLTELAAEYRPAYAGLCDQMIQASEGAEGLEMMSSDEESVRRFMDRQEKMSKLRFDRSELNQRAIAGLRAILSEDQVIRIGGLPEPQKENEFEIW